MGEKKKTPDIRFEGFSGDWELRELGDLVKLQNGYAFKSEHFIDKPSNKIVLTPGNVYPGGGYQEEKGRYYCKNEPVPEQFVFAHNDIFVTMTDLTPNAQSLGYPAKVPNDDKVYLHNQRLGKISPEMLDENYLYSLLTTDNYHREIVAGASGTTVKHTSPDKILNYQSYFPIIEEQGKIGFLFKTLDALIILQQRKYDKTVNMKKACLEKMFPKKGAKVPEVRFAGFSGDWVERTLEEVLTVNSGRDYKHLDKGNIPVYGTGGYMLSVNDRLSDVDGVGIGRKGTIDKPQYLKAPYWTVDTLFFLTAHENNNLLFLFVMAQQIDWKILDESTGVPSLSKVTIEKVQQWFPCLEEQAQIGEYFRQLDNLIALYGQELEKLKNIKKACLAKMFV